MSCTIGLNLNDYTLFIQNHIWEIQNLKQGIECLISNKIKNCLKMIFADKIMIIFPTSVFFGAKLEHQTLCLHTFAYGSPKLM